VHYTIINRIFYPPVNWEKRGVKSLEIGVNYNSYGVKYNTVASWGGDGVKYIKE
jgi:hypothetical protein